MVSFETTDPALAAQVAADINAALSTHDQEKEYYSEEYFAANIDRRSERNILASRPSAGRYAVAASVARPYEILGNFDNTNVYKVTADTRNSARDVPSERGVQHLQAALVSATGHLFEQ